MPSRLPIPKAMRRARTESRKQEIDLQFPHQVIITIDDASIYTELDAMHRFVRGKGWDYVTQVVRSPRGDESLVWCFADTAMADAFLALFGGKKLAVPRSGGG
jgi:hypothetical protein